MSKCRYDLSADCNNKDCLVCVLAKITAEIQKELDYWNEQVDQGNTEEGMRHASSYCKCLRIINKYRKQLEDMYLFDVIVEAKSKG